MVAGEPSMAMLAVLRAKLPSVEAFEGGAENIPLADGSVDAVTVAQAFHWFDRDAACAELRRLVVPGVVLGLLWNRADRDCTWDLACSRVAHPAYRRDDGELTPEPEHDELPGFIFDHRTEIAWSEQIARDDYIRRWLTVSSFLAADADTRADMVAQLNSILDADPATAAAETFTLPMITDVFVYGAAQPPAT